MIAKSEMGLMLDAELNAALHFLMYYNSQAGSQVASAFVPDYCNSANDIMPLAFENKICFIDSGGGWIAFLFNDSEGDLEFEDKNPLRAIACCLILVLQERK